MRSATGFITSNCLVMDIDNDHTDNPDDWVTPATLENLLDIHVFNEIGVLRTATIFFYISNEGISLLENATRLGLPVRPKSVKP